MLRITECSDPDGGETIYEVKSTELVSSRFLNYCW